MQENQNKFEYTYSAPSEAERREIESIRRQYEDRPTSPQGKLERLKKLDSFVKNSATCVSLVVGVIGLLIFGLGITMILQWQIILWGLLVGVVGLCPIIAAYPLYQFVLKRNKKKYSAEILQLTEELLSKKEED
ncbi:MAG: hypothetical protein IJ506_08085 [Clostridia bacterium]|nr:hypothetical protein [Clostridia bacterium]